MAKQKYYVVWQGRSNGIYETWDDCRKQIDGFAGAIYKSFVSKNKAIEAYNGNSNLYIGNKQLDFHIYDDLGDIGLPIRESISVDGAWNTANGLIEYQGVHTTTKEILFKQGPFHDGTNNIAEFLAIVHALAYCKSNNFSVPIYSDSRNAIGWIKIKKAKTKLTPSSNNSIIFDLLHRAEAWLHQNEYENKILKWETKFWGENPADFGRK
jgi:ribonuclease HI